MWAEGKVVVWTRAVWPENFVCVARKQLICGCVILNLKGQIHKDQNILLNTVGYVLSPKYLDRHYSVSYISFLKLL